MLDSAIMPTQPKKCPHGKRKSRCKECGGSSICMHGKQKSTCKECGGSSICMHGKRKSTCKECGGSRLCKTPLCETHASNPAYNGYCLRCCIFMCPHLQVVRNYKTKENEVVCRIMKMIPECTWISDCKIEDGCSKRRPDLRVDLGTHVLIVEIDEHEHAVYECTCEHRRMMEISQDFGHRNVVFIRFNPDRYTDHKGNHVNSCWQYNKKGIMELKDNEKWEERILALENQIKYWIKHKPEKMIEVVHLFYSESFVVHIAKTNITDTLFQANIE